MSGINVDMQDERGTTITAHNYLNFTDTRGKKRKMWLIQLLPQLSLRTI